MGKTVSKTDIGLKRKLNQDYVFTADRPVGKLPNLYLVADGMGGHKAGGFASKYTVETVVEVVNCSKDDNVFSVLHQAIVEANYRIRRKASEDDDMAGMGTTLVAATVMDEVVYVANVGDSRLYLVSDEIRQITIDHSLVEEMVRMGGINREQARNHENKNIITRAIGAQPSVNPDFFEVKLKKGERIFMCTDGVSNMLTDEEILVILNEDGTDEDRVEKIVAQANEHGGRDNMGIILVNP